MAAFILAGFMLLTGALMSMPVTQAVADASDYGPDGYFSSLKNEAQPMKIPIVSEAKFQRILFGKSGDGMPNPVFEIGLSDVETVENDGRYLVIGTGELNSSLNYAPTTDNAADMWGWSKTTSLTSGEALLWAEDVVSSVVQYDSYGHTTNNSFDSDEFASSVAKVSKTMDSNKYYSDFELSLLGDAQVLSGVCAKSSGCSSGYTTEQSVSHGQYRIFPLSLGDMKYYFARDVGWVNNFSDVCTKRRCEGGACSNGTSGYWLRSAYWTNAGLSYVASGGSPGDALKQPIYSQLGFRPALRLNLSNLLLTAASDTQEQSDSANLQMTYVETNKNLLTWDVNLLEDEGSYSLSLSGLSNLDEHSGMGWKVVDSKETLDTTDDVVLGSGRTNTSGNMQLPKNLMTDSNSEYDLYIWGQQQGNAESGWTNRATTPIKGTIQGWQVRMPEPPVSFGIDLTGTTTGTLKAYRIGEYDEVAFTQTGALKSVRLDTPEDLGTVLKTAAETAGGSDVDAGNPIGWVASRWLGYPTDPASDDVTSAFSPYAGRLQLFARALADAVTADGDEVLGGVQGSLNGLDAPVGNPVTLPVSGPGLYLIVDSSGTSLPIIVGTKVFNEAMEDVVEDGMVDFADAGVNGKPRLGQAALKTTVTDVAKFVVNDPGSDGFDVGSRVDFEVQVPVPSSLPDGVSSDEYVFDVADSPDSSLKFDVSRGVSVLLDTQDVSGELAGDITFTEDSLKVSNVGKLFAEGGSSQVVLRAGMSGKTVLIRYSAVLQTDALLSKPADVKANANTVTLTRTKSAVLPDGWTLDGDAGTEWKQASSKVYSFRVDVVKADKDALSTKLAGAEFEVSRDEQTLKFVKLAGEGEYRLATQGETGVTTVSTGAGGKLSLQGVEARELSFKETVAPSGYFKVSDFVIGTVPTWNEDVSAVTAVSYESSGSNLANVSEDGGHVAVLDPAWSLANLPYTGGIGILILLVVGALILVFAVRPYVLSKRAERDANLI